MKLNRTVFPNGFIIAHRSEDINVSHIVDQYRWDNAVDRFKKIKEEVKRVINKKT